MEPPDFRVIATDGGEGVTYTCGCPCVPTARPGADGSPGFEHCCCGKVHFVGEGAAAALRGYLAERQATKKREPEYEMGSTRLVVAGAEREVAWAFPVEAS